MGFNASLSESLTHISDFLITIVLSILFYYIAKYIIVHVVKKVAARTKSTWDDALVQHKVFNRMAFLIPGIFIFISAPQTLSEFEGIPHLIQKLTEIYLIAITLFVINSFFNSVLEISREFSLTKAKPIKGYMQIVKIVIYLIGAILIISILLQQSPVYLLGGLGAFSAVLLLVFKDAILGFVGSIQISANDMVRQGDWITMQKFNVDGIVIDISLTTVKVRNWDKSITTIPTYSLISDSFQNWRGMEEAGVRRIKRSLLINMNSVTLCSEEMIEKFRKIKLIREYVEEKEKELKAYNEATVTDEHIKVNGRRQTNLGVFRAYVKAYIDNIPLLDKESIRLVRQLQPNENGIPLEIYAFCKTSDTLIYENLQSDIFDHLLAIVPEFELQVFQNPSGLDVRK
jgi:miniconductance mechanosensitive channel